MTLSRKYFGDRAFYKKVLAVSVPIIIQNGITNFVGMLDNIMIGSINTEAMSGVSIVNQLLFIFGMVIFGAGAAGGIFTSQYHGAGNTEGVRATFRMKIYINLTIAVITIISLFIFGKEAISFFLHSGSAEGDLQLTLSYGLDYLSVMLIGLVPYALSQVYASTLRETEETSIPMYSGLLAIAVNCSLNFVLIFGLLGFPRLGVVGAAIATVISRFAELIFLVLKVHLNSRRFAFIKGVFRSPKVPRALVLGIISKGFPLLFNELIWSLAMTVRTHCISMAGLDAVAALNIQTTIYNVLNISYAALGNSIAIIVGNLLGAGKMDEAKDADRKLLVFSALAGAAMGLLQLGAAPIFPLVYNTTEAVRSLATYMMIVSAISMPMNALAISTYYTLRSGGLALITMLFDCVYAWAFTVSAAFVLAYFTSIGIHLLFAIVTFIECSKCFLGLLLVSKVRWARQLTADEPSAEQRI